VHNTYLSLLIEFGIPGLVLYGILFFNLFRLGRARTSADTNLSISTLRKAWPILLGVYLFNAFFVDMAYQFVIGLLFTAAGMLCSSQEAST
jgi:O-antigen ligase